MAEHFDSKEINDVSGDLPGGACTRRGLSKELGKTITNRIKSMTPRIVSAVEHCGTEYKTFLEHDEEAESQSEPGDSVVTRKEKRKLVIIMVGLPGRGKTYLCNKLMCYLNWCVLVFPLTLSVCCELAQR